MFDFDPRDYDDARDRDCDSIYDSRWARTRERDEREREVHPSDRDPRDPFVDGLDLPSVNEAGNVNSCKNDGWQHLTRADGTTFKNQGDAFNTSTRASKLGIGPTQCEERSAQAGLRSRFSKESLELDPRREDRISLLSSAAPIGDGT